VKNFISTVISLAINIAILCFVVFLIPKVTSKSYQLAKDYILDSGSEKVSKEVKVTIPEGATIKDIANILKKNELIKNSEMFTLKLKLKKQDISSFKTGEYSLDTAMSESEILNVLKGGNKPETDIVFTIPEGYTTDKIARKLENENVISQEDFLKSVNNGIYNYKFLEEVPKERQAKLEGYLFPDTYYFRNGTTGEEIVSKLLSRFDNIYTEGYTLAAKEKGYTMDQIITLASIIEKEAKLDEERAKIAGVIYNRLAQDMPLQMDSTINYAFELRDGLDSGRDERIVSNEDTEINSAYNTYKNNGLPIGPICNPGKASIEAALFPENNDYLYFVLKDAETGEHEFTQTYDEHIAAKNKYRIK